MQKIKDKRIKIRVRHLLTIFNIPFVKFIFMIVFHNVLDLLSLSFYLLSFNFSEVFELNLLIRYYIRMTFHAEIASLLIYILNIGTG
jgi:hypothetical protein